MSVQKFDVLYISPVNRVKYIYCVSLYIVHSPNCREKQMPPLTKPNLSLCFTGDRLFVRLTLHCQFSATDLRTGHILT